jgi:hypothetical protein
MGYGDKEGKGMGGQGDKVTIQNSKFKIQNSKFTIHN